MQRENQIRELLGQVAGKTKAALLGGQLLRGVRVGNADSARDLAQQASVEGSGVERIQIPRDPAARVRFVREWMARNQRKLAQGALASTLVLPMLAQAANGDGGQVGLEGLRGVAEVIRNADGSVTVVMADGREIEIAASDIAEVNGTTYVVADALDGTALEAAAQNADQLVALEALRGVEDVEVASDGSVTIHFDDGSSQQLAAAQVEVINGVPMATQEALSASGVLDQAGAASGAGAGGEAPGSLVGPEAGYVALGAIGLGAIIAGTSSGSSSSLPADPDPDATSEGYVIDGYISGATVTRGDASVTTDDNGFYEELGGDAGEPIVATGGVDISTGQNFTGELRAPGESTVVTPLTTMVQALVDDGDSVDDAVASVVGAAGLDAVLSDRDGSQFLLNFDPNAAADSDDAAEAALGLAASKAGMQVATLLQVAANGDASAFGELASGLALALRDGAVDLNSETSIRDFLADSGVSGELALTAGASSQAIGQAADMAAASEVQKLAMEDVPGAAPDPDEDDPVPSTPQLQVPDDTLAAGEGLSVAGTVEEGDRVSLIISDSEGNTLVRNVAVSEGQFELEFSAEELSALVDGELDVEAVASFAGSNPRLSEAAEQAIQIDRVAPDAPEVELVEDTGAEAGITSNGELLFSDVAAGVTRTITVNGEVVEEYAAPTEDGDYEVVVTDTDAAGNASSTSFSFTLDTVADADPAASLTMPGDVLGEAQVAEAPFTVAGLDADATAVARFVDAAGNEQTVDVAANGDFTVDLSALVDGEVASSLQITDGAGNSATSSGPTVSLDTTADAGPAASVSFAQDLVGSAAADDVSVTVLGLDNDATATLTLRDPADNQQTLDVSGNGAYSVDLSGLTDGTISSELAITDTAGNTATVTGGTTELDTQAPVAPTVALQADTGPDDTDGITSNGVVTVSAIEAGATWEYSLDEGSTWLEGMDGQFELSEGTYADGEVRVRQTDEAGNHSPLASLGAVTIDQTAPDAPTLALNADTGADTEDGITSDGTVNVSGLEAEASWQYSLDAGAAWIDGAGSDFTLSEGSYADGDLRVRQIDEAGNTSGSSQLDAVTVDDSAPPEPTIATVAGDNVIDSVERQADIQVRGTAEAGAAISVTIDGNEKETTADGDGAWSVVYADGELPVTGSPDSDVSVTATDVAGNVSNAATRSVSFEAATGDTIAIGTVAGDDIINDAESGAQLTVTGVSENITDGTEVTLTIGGESFTGTVSSNVWSVDISGGALSGVADGRYDMEVVADGGASATRTVTLDTTEPQAPTVELRNDTGASDSDAVTSDGDVRVTGLESGATWEYSTDGGNSWTAGSGSEFTLGEAEYAADDVQVRQTDAAGNTGEAASLGAVTVDTTNPSVSNVDATAVDGLQLGDSATVTLNFDEVPAGFSEADLTLPEGLSLDNLAEQDGSNGLVYEATVSRSSNSALTDAVISVGTDWTDTAGNAPDAESDSGTFSVTVADPITVGGAGAHFASLGAALDVAEADNTLRLQQNSFDASTLSNARAQSLDGLAEVELADGATLTVSAARADGATISAEDTASVVLTGLGNDAYDFSGITVTDGQFVTSVSGNVALNSATQLGNELVLSVASGASLALSAEQADGRAISGDGSVLVSGLHSTPDADLSSLTTTGTVSVNFAGSGEQTFTGNLGSATVNVSTGTLALDAAADAGSASFYVASGATLRGSEAQLQGISVSGQGSVLVTGLVAASDLSAMDSGLDVTARVSGANVDIRGNEDLGRVDTYDVQSGAALTLTAAQADGVAITGVGSANLTDLAATPNADLSGVEADASVTVESNVDFTGDLGSTSVTIADGRTLTLDASQVDARSIGGAGTLKITGDITAETDLSGITAEAVDLSAATIADGVDLTLNDTSDFTVLPGQTEGRSITGTDNENALTVDVSGLDYSGDTPEVAVDISTLGGNDTLLFNFGAGDDTRTVDLTGTLNLGDGTNTLEVSNGNVDLSGLSTVSGITDIVVNSTLTLSANLFSDLLDSLGTGVASLAGSGTIRVVGELSGDRVIDLNKLGEFTAGGVTPPTIEFPAGYTEGTGEDFIAPPSGSTLKILIGGEVYGEFDGTYSPESVTVFNGNQFAEAVALESVQTITLANPIAINSTIDASREGLSIDFGDGRFVLASQAQLILDVSEADGGRITGPGSVALTGASGALTADLSQVSAAGAFVVVPGDGNVDARGGQLGDVGFFVEGGGTLDITAGEAAGRDMGGSGSVNIQLGSDDASADLRGIGEGSDLSLTTQVAETLTFGGRFGTTQVEVLTGAILTASAAQLDGRQVSGDGDVQVTGLRNGPMADLSGVSVNGDMTVVVDSTMTFEGDLGTFDVDVAAGTTFSASAARLDGIAVLGDGAVNINMSAAGAGADLSAIDVTGGQQINIVESLTLAQPVLDDAVVNVRSGVTLTASEAQLDGVTVLGSGDVTVTDLTAGADLSLVLVSGNLTAQVDETLDMTGARLGDAALEIAAGATPTLTAEQLDGRTVTGDGAIELTGESDLPDWDQSGIAVEILRDLPEITLNDFTEPEGILGAGQVAEAVRESNGILDGTTDAEVGSTVTLTLAGQTYSGSVTSAGVWEVLIDPADIVAAEDGSYTVSVTVTDLAGNESAPAEQTFELDRLHEVNQATSPAELEAVLADTALAHGLTDLAGSIEGLSLPRLQELAQDAFDSREARGGTFTDAADFVAVTEPLAAYRAVLDELRSIADSGNYGQVDLPEVSAVLGGLEELVIDGGDPVTEQEITAAQTTLSAIDGLGTAQFEAVAQLLVDLGVGTLDASGVEAALTNFADTLNGTGAIDLLGFQLDAAGVEGIRNLFSAMGVGQTEIIAALQNPTLEPLVEPISFLKEIFADGLIAEVNDRGLPGLLEELVVGLIDDVRKGVVTADHFSIEEGNEGSIKEMQEFLAAQGDGSVTFAGITVSAEQVQKGLDLFNAFGETGQGVLLDQVNNPTDLELLVNPSSAAVDALELAVVEELDAATDPADVQPILELLANTVAGLDEVALADGKVVFGSAEADTLAGDTDDNILVGGDGDDVLGGDAGNDLLFGGAGSDTFEFAPDLAGNGLDVVVDFTVGDGDNIAFAEVDNSTLRGNGTEAESLGSGDALGADTGLVLFTTAASSLDEISTSLANLADSLTGAQDGDVFYLVAATDTGSNDNGALARIEIGAGGEVQAESLAMLQGLSTSDISSFVDDNLQDFNLA